MQIWIDADACPKVIKEVVFRAASRTKTMVILVANHAIQTPPSPYIKKIQVTQGFDVADQYIIDNIVAHDLVITADIPLADAVITKMAHALNPRGELYTKKNIKQQLSLRNFHADLRSGGLISGGPPTLGKSEVQAFANNLDQILARARGHSS